MYARGQLRLCGHEVGRGSKVARGFQGRAKNGDSRALAVLGQVGIRLAGDAAQGAEPVACVAAEGFDGAGVAQRGLELAGEAGRECRPLVERDHVGAIRGYRERLLEVRERLLV